MGTRNCAAKEKHSHGRSFGQLIKSKALLQEALSNYAAVCSLKLREQKSIAQFVKVFVRTNQHRLQDKQYHAGVSIQMDLPTSDTPTIIKYALKGLELIIKKITITANAE